jgi:hypothetical protein
VARDWRDDEIEQLEALVRKQQAIIEARQRTIAALEARARELEAQLAQYSGNSSRPPSSDPPGAAARLLAFWSPTAGPLISLSVGGRDAPATVLGASVASNTVDFKTWAPRLPGSVAPWSC